MASPELRLLARLAWRRQAFRLTVARNVGVHPEVVRRLAARGDLVRISRGLYALPDAEATEQHTLATVATRVPAAVICLLSALRFHDLGTQHPRDIWIAVDRSRAVPNAVPLPASPSTYWRSDDGTVSTMSRSSVVRCKPYRIATANPPTQCSSMGPPEKLRRARRPRRSRTRARAMER
jgi:hypothetical protein